MALVFLALGFAGLLLMAVEVFAIFLDVFQGHPEILANFSETRELASYLVTGVWECEEGKAGCDSPGSTVPCELRRLWGCSKTLIGLMRPMMTTLEGSGSELYLFS